MQINSIKKQLKYWQIITNIIKILYKYINLYFYIFIFKIEKNRSKRKAKSRIIKNNEINAKK